MGRLRTAIAGYGVVGRRRHDCLKCDKRFDIVAVGDKDILSIGSARHLDENQILVFDDVNKLIQLELDVLFVCLPNYLAPELTMLALNAGAHVFCEKPPGRDLDDIIKVRKVEQGQPTLKLRYGFNHRYHGSVVEASTIIDSGDFGKVLNVMGCYGKSSFFGHKGLDWRIDPKLSGGGILLDQGIHLVDLMRKFAGEFVEVKSFVQAQFWEYPVEDNAYAIMRTNENVVAMIHSSATMWQHTFSVKITLERGSILLSGILSGSGTYGEERIEIFTRRNGGGEEMFSTTIYKEDKSWGAEIAQFGDDIMLDRPVTNGNSSDAHCTMELISKIYDSDQGWRKFKEE